jgi:hypothetical protein
MDSLRTKQPGEIIALSGDMLARAQDEEWQGVAELDEQRRENRQMGRTAQMAYMRCAR